MPGLGETMVWNSCDYQPEYLQVASLCDLGFSPYGITMSGKIMRRNVLEPNFQESQVAAVHSSDPVCEIMPFSFLLEAVIKPAKIQ